ncbi:hypothetical protein LINGRAHAP2_LOCUS36080, partial [Linum grandiflorum]
AIQNFQNHFNSTAVVKEEARMMTMAMIVEPVAASRFAAGANIRCSAASSQSALRERRRRKSKSKRGNGVLFDASSIYGSSPSPGSAEPQKKIATADVPISVDDASVIVSVWIFIVLLKRRKSKSKQGNVVLFDASSIYGSRPSPGSAEPRKKIATAAVLISVDDVCSTSNANKLRYGKQISPVVFYGSPNGVPPKRPISLLRLLPEIRVDLSEQGKENLR